MAKETIQLAFEAYKPLELDRASAIALVKQRADTCMVMADFGWVRVPKRQMIGFLEEMREGSVRVMKEPHFTIYYFRSVAPTPTIQGGGKSQL